ncbi:hypothetical protein ACWGS9_14030 [Bradyrhizobium sp. Arg314]
MKQAAWIGVITLLVILLPAWAVKSASQQSRIGWAGFVLLMAFVSLAIAAAKARNPRSRVVLGPYVQRNFRYLSTVFAASFLIAGGLAIATTYAQPGVGFIGELGLMLSKKAASLVPVVAKYETAMDPPLSSEALFKVQSIVTAFLLAGTLSFACYAVYLVRMPRAERIAIYASRQVTRHSAAFLCFCSAFAVYVSFAAFAGFFEFEAAKAKWWCALQASCYARGDDLTIIAAAMLKVFAVFGFPFGAAVLVDSARLLPRES